ncbi:MAG: SsrA-binding protein [Candidatus Taylorbacteria bacterium CG10_big_fil_rev_8_21_14_0_10_41_48]|uniref:SsrA-binding protein n=1 Tax=Candidatus Taylorbacteria bacterium CG10_big_fil_rev_8_21_14_0_10_41_48 TaxID=1975024 RepID=A0A2M8LCR6_9BACT|nr:MAG: SsrA-binding protein [Candidatus Taylorbacteria bacterium CG10_big_fil_rev_8_21_14_0_10_41_48]
MALAQNKKVRFDYEVLEKYEAGIELLGIEVKSLRTHSATLDGSYVTVRGSEAFLMNMSIPPYQPSNTPEDYDPLRTRKLMLTKEEVKKLANIESSKGLTIVPISVYNKGKKLKVELAVVRGKKQYDKREDIKKRQSQRDIERSLKD